MSKNLSSNNNFNIKKEDIPRTLEDSIFYGIPLDDEQKVFRDSIWNPEKLIIACNAKAGTGKTTIALGVANLLVQYGLYDGIIYIASPTQEQRQGYLPGNQEEKSAPYMEPLLEAMNTLSIDPMKALKSQDNIQAIKNGTAYIEFTVDTYLRGCNFENKVVIVDECQNYYYDSLKKTLTRVHDSCKLIVIGHTEQCDLYKKSEKSGFKPYLKAFEESNDDRIAICKLSVNHRGWISSFCDSVEL